MPRIKKEKSSESILKSFVINTLRRSSYRWRPRGEAMKAARVGRGLYKCESCLGIFKNKEIRMDHREPVVDVRTGFVSWDIYINRLFCNTDGYSAICKQCHSSKTFIEKEQRKTYRKLKKASK